MRPSIDVKAGEIVVKVSLGEQVVAQVWDPTRYATATANRGQNFLVDAAYCIDRALNNGNFTDEEKLGVFVELKKSL